MGPTSFVILIALLIIAGAALWWLRRLRRDARLRPPSLFSAVGFAIANEAELTALLNRAIDHGQRRPAPADPGGAYYVLASVEGAEVWAALNPEELIEAAAPFFRAGNRNALRLLGASPDAEWRYEGVFEAVLADDAAARLPFRFACPDYLLHAGADFPQPAEITLVGFVHDAAIYPDIAAFQSAGGEATPLPPKAFTPAGLLSAAPASPTQTLVRGIVRQGRQITNSLTGQPFCWASVESDGVLLDLVGDPRVLSPALQAGNVIEASVWLAGDWPEHAGQEGAS